MKRREPKTMAEAFQDLDRSMRELWATTPGPRFQAWALRHPRLLAAARPALALILLAWISVTILMS